MILIIDFGSQTTHLIGRKVKELGIKIKIIDPENILREVKKNKPEGIILSGGPASVYEEGAPTVDKKIFKLNIPILGICYGWQLMAHLLGGKVESGFKEYGPTPLTIKVKNKIINDVSGMNKVWMSHGDSVKKLPKGFKIFANTENVNTAFVGDEMKKMYGIQFHPEIEHTDCGKIFLKCFLENICHLETRLSKSYSLNVITTHIKQIVGNEKVICALSGGVDSTVAAVLVGKAIGKNLIPIHVNSGLNRVGTEEMIIKNFKEILGVKPIIINAKREFLKRLKGVTKGEEKRKIIGKLYIDLFWKEALKLKVKYLAQGTLYSDVIESKGTKHASLIKHHHNVGGLPKDMKFTLVEPLRNLYKDEVKKLGLDLGIAPEFIFQQKFPGPGYAIRIMGEVNDFRLKQLAQADQIVVEEMKKNNLFDKVFHSFAIMTGVYTTALKGDGMKFREVVGLRILNATEEMTADWSKIPYEVLGKISLRIVNEVPDISRVVYDITTKPPATMEWE